MDARAPRPLNDGAARALALLLAGAWWALLVTLVHVCFLREGPRSLAHTARWFAEPGPWLLAIVAILLLAGLAAAWRGPRSAGLASALAGLLLGAVWVVRGTLLAPVS